MTPSRRALLAAGVATIAVSLVLSIAPVMAANGRGSENGNDNANGNAGTIKIHDATTAQETAGDDTDPHVCAFWVGFYASDPFETGTWQLLSWAPTGDGTEVASGQYDTSGDGLDATGTLSPDPGHFRFDWVAEGSTNGKHKTLWVDTCETDEAPPAEDVTPPGQDETPAGQDETPAGQDETPASQDETRASQDETPATHEGEGDVLAGNPIPTVAENPAPDGAVAAGGATTALPDTALPDLSSGAPAALGLLLLTIAAHTGTRRRPVRG